MKRNFIKEGFTLIELLVVISIIGLLSSVVLASLNNVREKGRWARMVTDFNQIAKAAELFYDSEGLYSCDVPPGYDGSWNSQGRYSPDGEVNVTCQDKGMVEKGYLPHWPKPPCAGWDYDWENWTPVIAFGTGEGQVVRVTLRGPNSSPYYFCILDSHGSTIYPCGGIPPGDPTYTLGGTMVNGVSSGFLSCQ